MARLYANENFPLSVVEELRRYLTMARGKRERRVHDPDGISKISVDLNGEIAYL